ncbi:MAG: tRNA pseudouridine(38-40) synthase TruA [Bacteroidales bacterium]
MAYRYFLKLSYDGTAYCGWQVQPNGNAVQAELEKALAIVFRLPLQVTGAGRTDTGVHAREMYAHFDLPKPLEPEDCAQAIFKMNNLLPSDIAIQNIIPVHPEAHARFDAVSRTYDYHLLIQKNPFKERFAWYWQGNLDVDAMNIAAGKLIGTHDFQCFSKVHTEVNNYWCTVKKAEWCHSDEALVFTITANRFLRNMVRAVVGTLFDIGRGKLQVHDLESIMQSRDRSSAGSSVPAKGLTLVRVEYPFDLP